MNRMNRNNRHWPNNTQQIMNKLHQVILVSLLVLAAACQSSAKKDKKVEETVTKVEVETTNESVDMSAFFSAALDGDLDKVKYALDNGADVNALDENQHSALMLAAYNGHHHILKVLIDKGATIDAVDATNRTPLMFASTGPFVQAVEMLIKAGADVNATDNHENWTPVMFAAGEGQIEVIKLLVANGADLSKVDVDGESALDFAQTNGHTATVEYLKPLMK